MSEAKRGARFELRGLTKQFKEKQVLKDINLTVNQGEFIAIVGRSGCGKSTLLRLIAGLESPSSGGIIWGDADGQIGKPGEHTRFLFQEHRLLPWKTVLDNVRIGAKNDRNRAAEVLEQVGLADRGAEWPSVLSGGQKQRVALARALASRPKLLLLDEPLGALDALTRIEMQQLIEWLWQEEGFTVILVTHDVSEAVTLADRVLLIEEGQIALDVRIELARQRERDNGFTYYENLVLQRVLGKPALSDISAAGRKVSYSI
ncbi:ATP-binding cassette domain-containing protein [Paenibacillus radicis (ex Gao et al. 2016)]|uniref:Aliphatic sulfonates import ATP-binding protein SsuB 1 n=1 Tax=Paenibacillus radicis (ex Gao et al. 2016) TaxID=1737354 RepID=A0A917H5N6_9BACL|nr:ATP-binding cassette domain-containing protein [Paenibacillus radicis (ex Gao et al. 2016)]GGG68478.1 aliphatic sulfonates import ATP-binding protein SsuB 1 [Paenibacillus radicis (ex Gao et al. 2016)]